MPRVKWEALKNEVIAKIFMETAESKIGAMEEGIGDSTRWTEVAGKLVEAVKELCGKQKTSVENEWVRNKVKEDGRLRDNITIALGRKNKTMVAQRQRTVGTEVVEARKEELKEARKERK